MPRDDVSSYVVELLCRHGMDTYFTVTGGSIVPLLNAVSLHPSARYYCFQHEQAAAMAAEGTLSHATGKVAVVCVTSGPGVQNIFNGVCGCWYDSENAFFICGQVSTTEDLHNRVFLANLDRLAFKRCAVPGIFSHVSKACLHLDSTPMITSCMRTLLRELYQPRFGLSFLICP